MALSTEATSNVTYQLQENNESTIGFDDYDGDDAGFTPEQICVMFMYIIIILLGLIGNSLVIFAICKRGRQNVTSLLLCSLAVSDLAVVLIYMPFKVMDLIILGGWIYGGFMCKLISYMSLVTPACSGCMLMVISLER